MVFQPLEEKHDLFICKNLNFDLCLLDFSCVSDMSLIIQPDSQVFEKDIQ